MQRGFRIPRHTLPVVVVCLFSSQAFGATSDLTLNGSAKILTGPGGGPVILLTPAQQGQAGSAFTTSSIVFDSTFAFATFFQFKMTDPGPFGASDGMTFVLQTQGASGLGANGAAR